MTKVGSIDAVASRWLASVKVTAHLYCFHPGSGTATQILMLSYYEVHAPFGDFMRDELRSLTGGRG